MKKVSAVLISLMLFVVMTYSLMFVAQNARHTCCDSDHCPVCYELAQANAVVNRLFVPVFVIVFAFSVFLSDTRLEGIFSNISYNTLITQKVRIDS